MPEALRLADELERYHGDYPTCTESAAKLRRLHAENERIHSGWIRENSPGGWIDDLRTQRDALLALLGRIREWHYLMDAAIKAAEGENHAKSL